MESEERDRPGPKQCHGTIFGYLQRFAGPPAADQRFCQGWADKIESQPMLIIKWAKGKRVPLSLLFSPNVCL